MVSKQSQATLTNAQQVLWALPAVLALVALAGPSVPRPSKPARTQAPSGPEVADSLELHGRMSAGSPSRLPGKPSSHAVRALQLGKPLDVNLAGAQDWALLPGIGPRLASRIVAFRQQHGHFQSPDELVRVRGIGPRMLAKLRPHLTVNRSAEPASPAEPSAGQGPLSPPVQGPARP